MDGRRVERVIFTGEHVDKNLTEAAVELSTGVRYLGLSIEHGGEGLAHLLRRNYGVAAQLFYKPEQVEPGDFILSFSEKGSWQNSAGQCLPLWDPSLKFRFRLPEALEIGTVDEEQLIALLYAARALKKEQLEVVSIFRNDGEKE